MFAQIFTLILTILYLLLNPNATFAQTSTPSAANLLPPTTYQLPANMPPTSPLFTDMLVNNIFHSFSCLAVGQSTIGQPCLTYQLTKNAQGNLQSIPVLSQVNLQGGTLGATTSMIAMLYDNPPIRTADYLASVGQGLGIVKDARAEVVGSGANVLSPILTLWQVSRNISYIIMIIIFLVVGLMVMFRNRINPQTVITAQAALPGLVIGLILITFSYFLAGLIADTAFLGTNIVGYYFQAAQGIPIQQQKSLTDDLNNTSVLKIFAPFTRMLNLGDISSALLTIWPDLGDPNLTAPSLGELIGGVDFSTFPPAITRPRPERLFEYLFLELDPQRVIRTLVTFLAIQLVSPFGQMLPGVGQAAVTIGTVTFAQVQTLQLAGFALAFIGMIALIYAMFRLLLRLINSFLTIIFLTITAPFQFLFASLPGRQGAATDWILNMLGNVLVFPAVLAVFYFVAVILGRDFMTAHCADPCPFQVYNLKNQNINALVPNAYAEEIKLVDQATFPLFGGLDLGFIKLLLAFGALMATPAIPDIVIRSVGKASQAGQLIGQEIGAGTGAGQRYAGQFQGGTQGLAGQVGKLTDEPGWYKVGGKWVQGYGQYSGARAGFFSKAGAAVSRGRKFIGF